VNGLKIEIYGDKASIHWAQEEPNSMMIKTRGAPDLVLHPGTNIAYLSPAAVAVCRTPGGHPEGYIEAFANLYAAFAESVRKYPERIEPTGFASVADGVASMKFIRAAVNSSRNNSAWTSIG
jgi:predicted dehydrogenase